MLKPQDIVILLKIFSTMTLSKKSSPVTLSQNKLAVLLCISVSEVNAGTKRLVKSGLLGPSLVEKNNQREIVLLPIKAACIECLVSGLKYFYPAQMGQYTRGIATSYAAPVFKNLIAQGEDPIPVWPSIHGNARGIALEPLYRSVPESLFEHDDPLFYELLALVDVIRSGRAREREIAIKLLKEKINDEKKEDTRNI